MTTPPETDREPVTDDLHGEQIVDPYRWLEDDEAVVDWERRQNEYTDRFVETDRRETLRPAFESIARRTTYHLPTVRGDRYFQRIEPPGADQPRLTVRTEREGTPRVLVDPASIGETVSLEWFVPGPDGDRVLCGLMEGGTEQYDLLVIDAEDGTELDRVAGIGRCTPHSVAWTDEGFYYTTTGSAGDGGQLDKAIRLYELDGTDSLVTDDIPPERWPLIEVDEDGALVLVGLGELATDSELYALQDGELVPVLTDLDATFDPLVHGGRVYLLTNHDAPRSRLLGIDAGAFAAADSPGDFEELCPESADVLADVAPAGDGIALHRLRDASSVVSVHDSDGSERFELSLPEYAGIQRGEFDGHSDGGELFFRLSGLDRPTRVVHADVGPSGGPDELETVQEPDLQELDPRSALDLTVDRLWVESTDGAEVPVYVVHRSDIDPDGDAPTLLYGYGGFRIPQLPTFDPYRLPFLRDGGVFALACLRGGLEFGERWHEAGSGANKEHTFDDFEAAAAALIDRGYTRSARLAGWGRSNGGLTVGAVLTRRPDLFGAIVCAVPLLDMLRFHRFLLGQAWVGEYGSPEDPDAFEWLRSFSPYHNVTEAAYPATLFATASGDTRVHPGHARKMTARVQAATTGEAPICFRSYEEAGHGTGTPTSLEVRQQLDKWTFLYEALEIDPTD